MEQDHAHKPSNFLVWAMQRSGGTSFTSLLNLMHNDPAIHEPFAGRRAKTEYVEQLASLNQGIWPNAFSSVNFKHCYEYSSAEFNRYLMEETLRRGYCPILLERDDEMARIESLALAELTGIYGKSDRDKVYSAITSGDIALPPIDIDWARRHLRRCLRRQEEVKDLIQEYDGHYVLFENLFKSEIDKRMSRWQSIVNTLKSSGLLLEDNTKYLLNRDTYLLQRDQNSAEISDRVPNIKEFRVQMLEILASHRASMPVRPTLREATGRRIFVDLGANVGNVSEKALTKEFFDIAWLFEPNPKLAEKLRVRFSGRPVEIIEAAAWNKNGTAPLYLGHPLSSTIMKGKVGPEKYPEFHVNYEQSIEVRTVDISTWLLGRIQKNDFIVVKMDVEGAEYVILPEILNNGLVDMIDEIRCEFHSDRFPNIEVEPSLFSDIASRTSLINWH